MEIIGTIKTKNIIERKSSEGNSFEVCDYVIANSSGEVKVQTTAQKFFKFVINDEVKVEYEVSGFYKKIKSISYLKEDKKIEKKIRKFILTLEEIE